MLSIKVCGLESKSKGNEGEVKSVQPQCTLPAAGVLPTVRRRQSRSLIQSIVFCEMVSLLPSLDSLSCYNHSHEGARSLRHCKSLGIAARSG